MALATKKRGEGESQEAEVRKSFDVQEESAIK